MSLDFFLGAFCGVVLTLALLFVLLIVGFVRFLHGGLFR